MYFCNLSLTRALARFYHVTSFRLSHRKTRWTMLVDNVRLETCLLGTSNFMGHSVMFSLV